MVFTSLVFLPSHSYADPGLSLMPEGTTFSQMDLLDEMVPIDNSPKMEELRAYVTTLDRLNSFVHPDLTDGDWEIKNINKLLHDRISCDNNRIKQSDYS